MVIEYHFDMDVNYWIRAFKLKKWRLVGWNITFSFAKLFGEKERECIARNGAFGFPSPCFFSSVLFLSFYLMLGLATHENFDLQTWWG